MRRRQQQHPPPQESQGVAISIPNADPESLSSNSFHRESMLKSSKSSTPMGVATTFEVESATAETRNKPFSLLPRSYTQRRELTLVGCFFLIMWVVYAKGKTRP